MGRHWPLVGREDLLSAVHQSLTGSGAVVLVGQAGVGKTRLAREVAGCAERPLIRWVAATATGQSLPLAALADFAQFAGPDPLRRVEELARALAGGEASDEVLICVDDAHLLDEQSARVVIHLVECGLAAVLLTVREGADASNELVDSLLHTTPRIEIPPLADDDVTLLLERVLGGPVETNSAKRLASYAGGNVLYLRQLVSDEASSDRLTQRAGVWAWDGAPKLSASLVELIEASIGAQPDSILDVLDVLAVCDPVELPLLLTLAPRSSIEATAERGLVAVDHERQVVRLGHPLYGEVRRARAGAARLRSLRGRVAEALGHLTPMTIEQVIRGAALMIESDGVRDLDVLQTAVDGCLQLLDLNLAIKLARAALQAGGGRKAHFAYAMAMALSGRGSKAEHTLAHLATAAEDAESAEIAFLRAANLAWCVARPADAESVLSDAAESAAKIGLGPSFEALRGSCRAARGQSQSAVDIALPVIATPGLHPMAEMLGYWGLTIGFGDLGQARRMTDMATRGYRFAVSHPEASHLRFGLGMMHISGLRLAGEITEARDVARRLFDEARAALVSQAMSASLMGWSELATGAVVPAQRWFREALANAVDFDEASGSVRELCGLWLTTALSMAGDPDGARHAFDATWRCLDDDYGLWKSEILLAEAWLLAAEGMVSDAIRLAYEAGGRARSSGRPAQEVYCLQTATQFGDAKGATRLKQLASMVEGPRAAAAAAHAEALRKRDVAALLVASGRYEGFGDRVAAADAAAHAAAISRKRKAADSPAAADAARLRIQCHIATPALRMLGTAVTLTRRQREVISLAAAGLSNRQIADRLVTSPRTVENHMLRAARRNGVKSREELIALLDR